MGWQAKYRDPIELSEEEALELAGLLTRLVKSARAESRSITRRFPK
jgi:hypothetical protein